MAAVFAGSSQEAWSAPPGGMRFDAGVRLDPRDVGGGEIPGHFVGVSIEWTLIDRYMGENSRPGFANLLHNLGSGVLRIGGSSQDQVPFDATAADSDRFITPHDLARIRATLDLLQSRSSGSPKARLACAPSP
jgi:hypothetical protein